MEIEETDPNEIEDLERDLVWAIEEFTDLNLFKCVTLQELLVWNFNVKIEEGHIILTGDHFSCSIWVKWLIDNDGEIAEICEQYIKKMILIMMKSIRL